MAENWKIEYDQRQYRLMADQLQRFEYGELDLASLIGGLKSLLSVLETADEVWKDLFRSEWGTLETIYAMALDRQEQCLAPDTETTINDPSHQILIKEAIRKLRRLVQERIETM